MQKLQFLFLLSIVILACQENNSSHKAHASTTQETQPESWFSFQGKTMGTTYNIKCKYFGEEINLKEIVDSTLVSINDAVSTYEANSTISQFNKIDKLVLELGKYPQQHFIDNYLSSKAVYENTDGAFDPTVMPLVNYWGFGYTEKKAVQKIDSQKVLSILSYVGLDKLKDSSSETQFILSKNGLGLSLDFSAIAKGYGVDEIAKLLEAYQIETYMVEIGGEVKVSTSETSDKVWKIGINEPLKEAPINSINSIVNPMNQSMATSGNYRIYYETKELSYGHEINPITGFPEQTDIYSASVIHESCQIADAYATAFMIMGLEKSMKLVNDTEGMEACFITIEEGELINKYSSGFEKYLIATSN